MAQTIMVVDDDKLILDLVKETLEQEGYSVVSANNGTEALAMVKVQIPDLILLDIMMPKIDGFSVCEMLKGDKKFKDIPIVMLTAKSLSKDIEEAYERGADEYIIKPFDSVILLRKIRELLEN